MRVKIVKPVNLNQLLFHTPEVTLSFFLSPLYEQDVFESFLDDMHTQLELQSKTAIARLLEKHRTQIKKIKKTHPEKSHGFFISESLQGYVILESNMEAYCTIGTSFHVRPLLEDLFVNPEYLVVNVSLYDIKVFKGDFQHLEIIQHYEFDQLAEIDSSIKRSHCYAPHHIGLIPYKTMLAIKTIANKVIEQARYHSMPVMVTGLDDMKNIFLRYFSNSPGIISHIHEDFYEKTCVEILQKCKQFRYAVMDHYSAQFKERLIKMVKSKRLISELSEIIQAAINGRVIQLVLPIEKKVWGSINLESGEYSLHKKEMKSIPSVDILNELAEEVMKQGGKIYILPSHFFPQNTSVLAILRG
jgi:hypothetical protein